VADGGEAALYQRLDSSVGPGNCGEHLPGSIGRLDVAQADFKMPLILLTAADEGRIHAQGDRGGRCCRLSRGDIPHCLAHLECMGAQGFGIGPGIKRKQLFEHAGCDAVGQAGGKLCPDLVELGGRAALRRPLDPDLLAPTAGTAKARQPNRDSAEQGGNPAGTIIFDPAYTAAGPACRPVSGMIPALGSDDRLLNLAQQLLTLRELQPEVGKVAEITRVVDLQHVNTARRPLDPTLHQTQYPPHS
jgi:hypothetical protein